jgi:hypothetical protein
MQETAGVVKSDKKLLNKEGNILSAAHFASHLFSTQMHVIMFSLRDAVSVCKLFLTYIPSIHVLLTPCLIGNFSYISIQRISQRYRRPICASKIWSDLG